MLGYQEILTRLEELERLVATRLPHRQPIYLGDNRALAQLHNGRKIYVDTRDVGICSHLMWEGRWEPWIERELMPLVKPGMRVCDIGANFGYYTLLFADAVGPAGHVRAFEPNPEIFACLRNSISVNGFGGIVSAHDIALSDKSGDARLRFDPQYSGGGALTDTNVPGPGDIAVKVATLDSFAASGPPIQLIKLDVEGAEPLVLDGGRSVFDGPDLKVLVMEFHPAAIRRHGPPEAIVDQFIARGFQVSLLEPSGPVQIASGKTATEAVGSNLSYILCVR